MSKERATASTRPSRIEPLTRLATGGMADIWLALEVGAAGMERFVVVKRLLPHLAREPDIVDMFVSEARFVAQLVHPNVVQIHDLGEDDEGLFLVMEYVAGCTVRELLTAAHKDEHSLPPEVAVSIVEQACRGAHAAHELTDPTGTPLGLVHRDISPHNLMIGPGGNVKLLDFGIAKATELADATRTGTVKGKHGYMSPEQCRAGRVDRRSDVFSLGIVCWELLTGERCFKRDTDFATMEAIVHGDFQLPSEVRADLPPAFDAVIQSALALDPDARCQTADSLRLELMEAAEQSGVRPSRDVLTDQMEELLGPRLKARAQALRDAASDTTRPAPSALREALVPSETSLRPAAGSGGSDPTASSVTTSDDVATVVQRRADASEHPPAEREDDEPTSVEATSADTAHEVETHTNLVAARDDEASPPGAEEEPPTSVRATPAPPEQTAPPDRAASPITKRSPEASPWTPRRVMLLLGGAAAVVAIVLWARPPDSQSDTTGSTPQPSASTPQRRLPAAPSGPPLRFVMAPTVKPEVIRREMAPLLDWLGREVERPIELSVADSYEQTGELLSSGRAHFGLLPPLLFVRTHARVPDLQPLAVRLFDGSRTSDGYLLVHDDAPLSKPDDLRGRSICHVDRTSTTGYLLPRIWMRKAGLAPDRDVRTIISGDHLAALRDLAAGKCDAASVYSGAFLSARKEGISVGKMRILAITGRVPQDTLAAAPDLPAETVERLRKALLRFQPRRDIDAGRVGEVLGISGFAAFAASDFDTIREAAVDEGLIDGPPASAD